jgi:hypothetical protein
LTVGLPQRRVCQAEDGLSVKVATEAARRSTGARATKIYPTGERTLRVLGVRDDDADQPPALVVEDLPGSATSATG